MQTINHVVARDRSWSAVVLQSMINKEVSLWENTQIRTLGQSIVKSLFHQSAPRTNCVVLQSIINKEVNLWENTQSECLEDPLSSQLFILSALRTNRVWARDCSWSVVVLQSRINKEVSLWENTQIRRLEQSIIESTDYIILRCSVCRHKFNTIIDLLFVDAPSCRFCLFRQFDVIFSHWSYWILYHWGKLQVRCTDVFHLLGLCKTFNQTEKSSYEGQKQSQLYRDTDKECPSPLIWVRDCSQFTFIMFKHQQRGEWLKKQTIRRISQSAVEKLSGTHCATLAES